MHAQEELADNCAALNRSTVRVSYFSAEEGDTSPFHTVHFDFGPGQTCHPTFHAQLTTDVVVPSIEEDEGNQVRREVQTKL